MTRSALDPGDPALLDRFRALARTLVADPDRADDLGQELWLKARGRPALGSRWWTAVGRNWLRSEARSVARRSDRERQAARTEVSETDAPDRLAAIEEQRRRIAAAVRTLPAAERDVVVARYWEGLTPREIAKRRDEPASSVRARLSRATTRLRRILDAEHGGDRRAWALPLLGSIQPPGAPLAVAGAAAVTLHAGWWCAAAAGLVAAAIAVGALWPRPAADRPEVVSRPDRQVVEAAPATPTPPNRTPAVADAPEPPPAAAPDRPDRRLVTSYDVALAGVAYWRGPAPDRGSGALPPLDTARTGPDGGFEPQIAPGEGPWLWFEQAAGHLLGIAADREGALRAPAMTTRQLEIGVRERGEPWSLKIAPVSRSGEVAAWLNEAPSTDDLVIRRHTLRFDGAGAGAVSVKLLAGRSYQVSAWFHNHEPRHYQLDAERGPWRVLPGRSFTPVPLRIAGAIPQRSGVEPLWISVDVREQQRTLRNFAGSNTRVGWHPLGRDDEIHVLLPDGEHLTTTVQMVSQRRPEGAVVLPGTGQPARVLTCRPPLPSEDRTLRVLVVDRSGDLRPADRIGVGDPFLFLLAQIGWRPAGSEIQIVGAGVDADAPVFVVADDGRAWLPEPGGLSGLPAVPVRSPELASAAERHGSPTRARIVLEARLPGAPTGAEWQPVTQVLAVRHADRWWATPDASGMPRLPLADPWPVGVPQGLEWRFRAGPQGPQAALVDITP